MGGTSFLRGPIFTRNFRYPLSFLIVAHSFAHFCTNKKLNSFVFRRFRTLWRKTPEVGGVNSFATVPVGGRESRIRPGVEGLVAGQIGTG
jgi:hypothetical protein